MVAPAYNAVIRQDGEWWIGWIEEIPGVNSQGATDLTPDTLSLGVVQDLGVGHTGRSVYLPIEVKYRRRWSESDLKGVEFFRKKYECHLPLIVTRERAHFAADANERFRIPLPLFLLLFD